MNLGGQYSTWKYTVYLGAWVVVYAVNPVEVFIRHLRESRISTTSHRRVSRQTVSLTSTLFMKSILFNCFPCFFVIVGVLHSRAAVELG